MLDNHLSVHITRAISHSHMTYAKNRSQFVPIEFKSGPSYVKHTIDRAKGVIISKTKHDRRNPVT